MKMLSKGLALSFMLSALAAPVYAENGRIWEPYVYVSAPNTSGSVTTQYAYGVFSISSVSPSTTAGSDAYIGYYGSGVMLFFYDVDTNQSFSCFANPGDSAYPTIVEAFRSGYPGLTVSASRQDNKCSNVYAGFDSGYNR